MMAVLPDLLRSQLTLVFCGTAPSPVSAARQAYYAHGGNLFWQTLYRIGLTPVRLDPQQYPQLLEFGIGLTDLNKVQSGTDANLDPAAYDVAGLRDKISAFRPRVLAFTSKQGATVFFGRSKLAYGLQAERIGGTRIWVLPSTSGSARPHWSRLEHHWFDLAAWLQPGDDRQ
jgi:double-stranded uracil-DNA glycosylase